MHRLSGSHLLRSIFPWLAPLMSLSASAVADTHLFASPGHSTSFFVFPAMPKASNWDSVLRDSTTMQECDYYASVRGDLGPPTAPQAGAGGQAKAGDGHSECICQSLCPQEAWGHHSGPPCPVCVGQYCCPFCLSWQPPAHQNWPPPSQPVRSPSLTPLQLLSTAAGQTRLDQTKGWVITSYKAGHEIFTDGPEESEFFYLSS